MRTATASKRTRHSVPNTEAAATPSTSRVSASTKARRRRTSAAQPSDPRADDAAEAVRVPKPKRRHTEPQAQQQREEKAEAEDETLIDTFAQLSSLLSSLQSLYAEAESASSSSDRATLRARLDGLLRSLHTASPSSALPQQLPESSIVAVQSSIAVVTALAPRVTSVSSQLALPRLQLQDIVASPASFSPIHVYALLQSSVLHLCRHLLSSLSSSVSETVSEAGEKARASVADVYLLHVTRCFAASLEAVRKEAETSGGLAAVSMLAQSVQHLMTRQLPPSGTAEAEEERQLMLTDLQRRTTVTAAAGRA